MFIIERKEKDKLEDKIRYRIPSMSKEGVFR